MNKKHPLDVQVSIADITIFSSIISIALATVYCFSRIGFDIEFISVGKTLTTSLFLLSIPNSYRWVQSQLPDGTPAILWGSPAFLLLIGLLFLAFSSLASFGIVFIALIGILSFVNTFVFWWRSTKWIHRIVLFFVTSIFSVWIVSVTWGIGYHTPLFRELAAMGLFTHQDTWFHAAVSSMIQTHDITTSGLDGIPYLSYHAGSHWLFAYLGRLLDIDSIVFYQLAYPVIFVPIHFFTMLILAIRLRQIVYPQNQQLGTNTLFWIIFPIIFISPLPIVLMNEIRFAPINMIVSESYNIALVFAYILGHLGLDIVEVYQKDSSVSFTLVAFLWIIMPLLFGMMIFSKISLILIGLTISGYVYLRYQLYKHLSFNVSGVITALVIIFTYSITYNDAGSEIVPFYFLRYYVGESWLPLWPLLYFIYAWFFILMFISVRKIFTLGSLKLAIIRHEIVIVEIMILVAMVVVLPGLVFATHGASAIYFSDTQQRFSIILILTFFPVFWKLLFPTLSNIRSSTTSFWDVKLKELFLVFVSIMFVMVVIDKINVARTNFFQKLIPVYNTLDPALFMEIKNTIKSVDGEKLATIFEETDYQNIFEEDATYYPILFALDNLSNLPSHEKQNSLLFIPHSNRLYWEIQHRCSTMPFIAPAITGIAMLDGLPEVGCEAEDYGYGDYTLRIEPQPLIQTLDYLCDGVIERGFSRLIILDTTATLTNDPQRIDCVSVQKVAVTNQTDEELRFGENINLHDWAIYIDPNQCHFNIGSLWSIDDTIATPYSMSMRLIDKDDALVSQVDFPPTGVSLEYWERGTTYFDYRQLEIPCDADQDNYQIIVLVYDYLSGETLQAYNDEGLIDDVVLDQ